MVERLEPLPGPGAPDDDPAVVDRGRIERVDRLAELDHHVVRGVDDVADRALTGGQQAHLDAIRGRPDVDVAHPATDEARTEVAIDDLDREPLGRRAARLDDVAGWEPERPAGHRRDLAGQADDRQQVAAVGLDVDIEDGVAEQLDERPSERRVRGEDEDPVRVGGQPELVT